MRKAVTIPPPPPESVHEYSPPPFSHKRWLSSVLCGGRGGGAGVHVAEVHPYGSAGSVTPLSSGWWDETVVLGTGL